MEDIMKIIKSLKESGLLIKGVIETIKNQVKNEQEGGFTAILIGTLGAILLGSILVGKGLIRASEEVIRAEKV